MSPAQERAVHDVDILLRVRARLEAAGSIVELYQMRRMSVAELKRLVWLEVNRPVMA